MAVPCRSQGRKRAALGETSGPGKSGIHPAPLFAAAGRWLMRVAAWANATTSTPARAARSEAERAERGAAQMRPCTPTRSAPSATGRQFQKLRESIACPKAGPNRGRHRYAAPRAHGGLLHRSAPKRPFLLDRALRSRWRLCRLRMRRTPCGYGPFSFRARPKRKWGVHCPAGNSAEFSGRQIAAPTAFTGEPARIRHRGPARAMSQIRISTPWARR